MTGWARAVAMIALAAVAACKTPTARPTTTSADATMGAPEDAVAHPPDAAVARCGPSPGPALAPGRATGAAAVLTDGTIVMGGRSTMGGWSAILDPALGTMVDVVVPGAIAAIRMVRAGDAIVMLGSADGLDPATAAVRFDPQTRRWRKPMSVPRCATAGDHGELDVTVEPIALGDGTVLVVGDRCALVLDANGIWTETAPLVRQRRGFTLIGLRNGDVLRVGGLAWAEGDGGLEASTVVDRYEVATRRWVAAASAHYMRYHQAAVRLSDGRVLVIGGCEDSGTICHSESRPAPPPEIYDPVRDRWTVLGGAPVTNRERATLTALPDGRVVVLGGFVDEAGSLPPTGVLDGDRWFALPPLADDRGGQVAVSAGDHVLFSGPLGQGGLPPLEWYGVAADCPATQVELVPARPPVGGSYP